MSNVGFPVSQTGRTNEALKFWRFTCKRLVYEGSLRGGFQDEL